MFTTIALDGPLTASAVGEQLLLDKGQMSRVVAALEERNLVVRTPDPNDRRAQLLEATPEAKARLDAIHHDPSERSLKRKLDRWHVADIRRLADLLHALNRGRGRQPRLTRRRTAPSHQPEASSHHPESASFSRLTGERSRAPS